jgi:lactate dehydrogenase-like 2-hydroxyacid dehydrogenase
MTLETADKAKGYDGVSCFVANYVDEQLMAKLTENGIKFITLRSAGYDYTDGIAAKNHNTLLLAHLNTRHKQFLSLQHA